MALFLSGNRDAFLPWNPIRDTFFPSDSIRDAFFPSDPISDVFFLDFFRDPIGPFFSDVAVDEEDSDEEEEEDDSDVAIDWVETADAHVFKADLPGLSKDDVKVTVEDGRMLTMSGERKTERIQESDKWHRLERSHGSFMCKFKLPENVDADGIKAEAVNGVLTVSVPNIPKPEAKIIQVV